MRGVSLSDVLTAAPYKNWSNTFFFYSWKTARTKLHHNKIRMKLLYPNNVPTKCLCCYNWVSLWYGLVLTHRPLKDVMILNVLFSDKLQRTVAWGLWNCFQVNATEPHWWEINISSGNGLVLSGTKPQWVKWIVTAISSVTLPWDMIVYFIAMIIEYRSEFEFTIGTSYHTLMGELQDILG